MIDRESQELLILNVVRALTLSVDELVATTNRQKLQISKLTELAESQYNRLNILADRLERLEYSKLMEQNAQSQ